MAQGLRATGVRNPRDRRMPIPADRSGPHPMNDPVASVPIDEIYPLYPGEWVAVKVTALDEDQNISHGEVLAHSRSRKKVSRALLRAHRADPSVHTYLFVGGSEPATTEEWREQLAQAAGEIKDYKDYLYAGR